MDVLEDCVAIKGQVEVKDMEGDPVDEGCGTEHVWGCRKTKEEDERDGHGWMNKAQGKSEIYSFTQFPHLQLIHNLLLVFKNF